MPAPRGEYSIFFLPIYLGTPEVGFLGSNLMQYLTSRDEVIYKLSWAAHGIGPPFRLQREGARLELRFGRANVSSPPYDAGAVGDPCSG